MKAMRILLGGVIAAALAAGAWILVFHSNWVKGAPDEDEDAAEVMPLPSVKLGKITRATVRRYVEGYGTVEAQPSQAGIPAASARVASPVAGLLAEVLCSQGQRVEKGALLFQLDERSARAEEEKASAAVGSAQASLDKLKSFPRPDQIKVAEMQVDRARQSFEFSQKKHARQVQLAADQLASEKTLQEAALELAGARNDLAIAEKQLLLLQSTPTKEEVAEAQGKVVEAQKSLAAAQVQRSLLKIQAPLSGTVVRARVNAGEAVDLATILAEIVDLDRLVVEGLIPSPSLRSVAIGMDVEFLRGGEESKAPAQGAPDKQAALRGKIIFVGLDVDRKTDTGFVRVALPAKAGIAPGQFVRLRIIAEEHKDHLVVPRDSVVQTAEGKPCIVGFLGEKAVQKEVRVGLREGDLIEIEGDEVDEGDVIVTQGAYGLPGEAKVRILKDK
jgi:membrane fusion protein (multidrug efflux system)